MKFIDAHCHIMPQADMDDARAAGVTGFILNSARPDDWKKIVRMTLRHDDVFGAIGIHPWYAGVADEDMLRTLRAYLTKYPKLMVGEIGLDNRYKSTLLAQVRLFREQLQIAHDLNRAVHVHCVGAWGHLLGALRDVPRVPAIVMHHFSAHPQIREQLEKYGACFSLVPWWGLRDSACLVEYVIESDAPDGCAPAEFPERIEHMAQEMGMDAAELADIFYNNALKILNNGQI